MLMGYARALQVRYAIIRCKDLLSCKAPCIFDAKGLSLHTFGSPIGGSEGMQVVDRFALQGVDRVDKDAWVRSLIRSIGVWKREMVNKKR